MLQLKHILKNFCKDLKYLELNTFCYYNSDDFSTIHLCSVVKFVEASSDFIKEEKNNLTHIRSYVEIDNTILEKIFSDLNNGKFEHNNKIFDIKTLTRHDNFKYTNLDFEFYQKHHSIDGSGCFLHTFQCAGFSSVTGDDLSKGIYSFGVRGFENLSKEKLGMSLSAPDGGVHIIIPLKISVDLNVESKNCISAKTVSNIISNDLSYSLEFFKSNDDGIYPGKSHMEIIKKFFQKSERNNICNIDITESMLNFDSIFLSLFDTEHGLLLFYERFEIKTLLAKSSVYTSVLQEAYSLFRNPNDFEKKLFNPSEELSKEKKPQYLFEIDVTRLLNCGGLQAIWLGENDSVKQGDVNLMSADILAYDDRTLELYVISCKIGNPKSDEATNKVINAKNVVEQLLKRPEISIRPCIITLQDIEETPFMRHNRVILINKHKLLGLYISKSRFTLASDQHLI